MRPQRTGDCTVRDHERPRRPGAPSGPRHWAARIAAGELSPVEVVARALAAAADVQPALNCFTGIWARRGDAGRRRGGAAVARGDALGALHGVPVAVKDTTPVAGHRTTLGSYAFEHWVPDRDAYVVDGAAPRRGDHRRQDDDARVRPHAA